MTCVAAMRDSESRWAKMIGDTRRTTSHLVVPIETPKIWLTSLGSHECIVGGTGSCRYMEIAQHLVNVDRRKKCSSLIDFLRQVWVPAFRSVLEKHGQLAKKNGIDDCSSGLLFVSKQEIVLLNAEFYAGEISELHVATGSGGSYAVASLDTSAEIGWDPDKRLNRALQIAAKHTNSVGEPFKLLTLK
jgi:hypothetical protein